MRCKPDQPSLAEQYATKVAEICRSIERAEETPKLAKLAEAAGLSTYHFHRVFKAVTGSDAQGLRCGAPDREGP